MLAALVVSLALGGGVPAYAEEARPSQDPRAELARLVEETKRLQAELADALARAEASALPEKLAAIEAELARIREELQRLSEQSSQAANAVDALSHESQRATSVTLYGDMQANAYRGERSLLDAALFEVVFSGHPHKRLSFIAQIEFDEAAAVGGREGGEIVVEQAYATLAFSPLLNLRAGAFLVPFGYRLDHFPTKRDVVTRPLVQQAVAPQDWSDNGIGLSGRHLFGQNWLLTYEAWLGAGLGSQLTSLGLQDAKQGYGVDNNGDKALMGRAAIGRSDRGELGLSGYECKYDDAGRKRLAGWSVDAHGTLGPLRLVGEYDAFDAADDARYHGYFVRAVYAFGRSLLSRTALGRDFEEPQLAAVLEYGSVTAEGPSDSGLERNREGRLAAGLAYRPSSAWMLKLAYESNDATHRPVFKGDSDGWVGSIAFVF